MPARLDIALQRNEDWARTLTLTAAGKAIDLSGMSFGMQVRDKLSQTLIAEASITVEAPQAGIVSVLLRGSEGSPLSRYGQQIQDAQLFYDFRMTDEFGTNIVLFGGYVLLSRGETRQ